MKNRYKIMTSDHDENQALWYVVDEQAPQPGIIRTFSDRTQRYEEVVAYVARLNGGYVDALLWWLRNGNKGGPFLSPRHLMRVAEIEEPELEINWYRKDREHPEPDINVYDPQTGTMFSAPLVRGVIAWEAWEEEPIIGVVGLTT